MNERELNDAIEERTAVVIASAVDILTEAPPMARGHVIAYSENPMVCIQQADGSKTWHVASLAHRDPGALTFEQVEAIKGLFNRTTTAALDELLGLVEDIKRIGTEETP